MARCPPEHQCPSPPRQTYREMIRPCSVLVLVFPYILSCHFPGKESPATYQYSPIFINMLFPVIHWLKKQDASATTIENVEISFFFHSIEACYWCFIIWSCSCSWLSVHFNYILGNSKAVRYKTCQANAMNNQSRFRQRGFKSHQPNSNTASFQILYCVYLYLMSTSHYFPHHFQDGPRFTRNSCF